MNSSRTSTSNRVGARDLSDFGEIQNIPEVALEPKLRSSLKKEEEEVSLPPAGLPAREVAALESILGTRLTVDNPVWSGDPVPRLRALQKKLVECSLALEEHDRAECMGSISLVERAVQLRLRWLQMRRSDAEREALVTQGIPGNEDEGKTRRNTG